MHEKLKNIEFLKIVLILTVVLFHMKGLLSRLPVDMYKAMKLSFANGLNSVEGFFIISGFFLVLTFKNIKFWQFFYKKYVRLAPVAVFSVIICWIAGMLGILELRTTKNIISGLLLSHFGTFWCDGNNYALWYLSALLFGFVVFYFFIKYTKENLKVPFFLFIAVLSYTILTVFHGGSYDNYKHILLGFLSVGILKAFGGLSLGCAIGCLYKKYSDKIREFSPNLFLKIFISFLEILTFLFILWWSFFVHDFINNIYYVYAFTILFVCFICNKGILSNLTNKELFSQTGKYTYSIYVIHVPVIQILFFTCWQKHVLLAQTYPYIPVLCNMFLVILFGILTYYFVEKPSHTFFCKFLQK